MDDYQLAKNCEVILTACMKPVLGMSAVSRQRLEQAVHELAHAQDADFNATMQARDAAQAEGKGHHRAYVTHNVDAWIDRWILTQETGTGIFAEEPEMRQVRTALLARARDIERRQTISRSGGRAMRLVVSSAMGGKLRQLMQREGIDSQQSMVEHLVNQAHEAAFGPIEL
jgi:hypothetical protein